MAVINAKLLCLCLVAVAATVAAHEAQTLPGKGGKGQHGVQTVPGHLGDGGGFPPRNPPGQPRPGTPNGRPGNNLKPIVRPGRPSTRPVRPSTLPVRPSTRPVRPLDRPIPVPPFSGPLTKPLPRPSKGGDRFRRSNDYDSPESDEGRYRRHVDDEGPDSPESDEARYRRQADDEEPEDDGEDEYYDEEEV